MNYQEINEAILNGRDVDEKLIKKDENFYKYLFNNKVAYYYSSQLSENKTKKEEWIIKRGDELNRQYIKTLEYIKNICDKNDIPFILFKTHKVIPEVVDGDIDLIIKEKDFQKFLNVFTKVGFDSIEDEPGKGKCIKDGYNVIEPHITISWRGNSYFDEELLWKYTVEKKINGMKYIILNDSVEMFIIIAELLYVPEYIDLYSMFKLKNDYEILNQFPYKKEIIFSVEKIRQARGQMFPIFAPIGLSFKISTRELVISKNIKKYFIYCTFYLYWRLRYIFIKKLPFTHEF